MKLQQVLKQYLLIAILPLIGIVRYKRFPHLTTGYLIGMAIACIQLIYSYYRGHNIADRFSNTRNKSMIITGSMIIPTIIIAIALILVYKLFGKYALYTAATALLLQKTALYLLLIKK